MSQTYTITEAHQGRTYTGKHGDLVVWRVQLRDTNPTNGADAFELHKKPGNTPNPGDTIEVDRFSPGEHDGTPFVRIFAASQQGGGSTSSTGGGKSPDQQRSIVRQHSQEMALRFIAATGDLQDMNLSDPALVGAYLSGTVRRLTDWFANDASAAAPAQQTLNGGGGEVPADMRDMAPAATASAATRADEDIPFARPSVPDLETRRRDLFTGDRAF